MLVLVTGHAFVKRKEWSGVTLKIQDTSNIYYADGLLFGYD